MNLSTQKYCAEKYFKAVTIFFLLILIAPLFLYAEKIINLNSATREELISMLNIDKFKAIEIINYRNGSGGFRDINELAMILKPEHVENIVKGFKTVELRTRQINLPAGTKIWIYSTLPK